MPAVHRDLAGDQGGAAAVSVFDDFQHVMTLLGPERLEATLLHGYANPLKRLDTSESVNLHKCLILLDFCRIPATSMQQGAGAHDG